MNRVVAWLSGSAALMAGVVLVLASSGCSSDGAGVAGGNAGHGKAMLVEFGCGTCHTITGIRSARGKVGPPLDGFAGRRFIAGELPNTPRNVVRFIVDPPAVEPGTAMPDMNVPESAARDIAAYLQTRR